MTECTDKFFTKPSKTQDLRRALEAERLNPPQPLTTEQQAEKLRCAAEIYEATKQRNGPEHCSAFNRGCQQRNTLRGYPSR
jgi:hypothetical protein